LRLKGFSKEEIDDFSYAELLAIDKAIFRINGENANIQFLAQDYLILKQAQPTDKKGKADRMAQRKYQKQADKLYNLITTGKETREKPPTKKLTEEEKVLMIEELKLNLPRLTKPV